MSLIPFYHFSKTGKSPGYYSLCMAQLWALKAGLSLGSMSDLGTFTDPVSCRWMVHSGATEAPW